MKINSKFYKLIHTLSNNSRTTTKEISKSINTSQQNSSYLIKKLSNDKIISSFTPIIDSSKFSLDNFCILISLKKSSNSFKNLFFSELKKYKEITTIDFLFGSQEIFLRFTTPNASNFNKQLREILNEFQNGIKNYVILTQIVLHLYPKNYLSKNKSNKRYILSGDREPQILDNLDKIIINELNKNCRKSFVQIANKYNSTAKTIITRVRALEKKRILQGYTININHSKLNIKRFYVLIKFDFMNTDLEKKFLQHTYTSLNIIEYIKTFGEWDAILTIETFESIEFKKILNDLKEKFSNIIEDYSFLESEEIKKLEYVPKLEI